MRKSALALTLASVLAATAASPLLAAGSTADQMTVFKSPTCGCCGAWVKIMQKAGFAVETKDVENIDAVKKLTRVPGHLASCHTAKIGGYLVEGHVPPRVIRRLLNEKPGIRGIAVPGMPYGSPGMGYDPAARYDVMTIPTDQSSTSIVYEAIGK
jgi:hypothetical protein